jgi:hypothetical protein
MNELFIEQFTASGDVRIEKTAEGHYVTFPAEGGSMTLEGNPGHLGGVDWNDATHFVLDITGLEDFDLTLVLHFSTGPDSGASSVIVSFGALPGLRAQFAFPLSALDSNKMFMRRTPGILKTVVMGRGITADKVIAIAVTAKKCHVPQRMYIHRIYLSKGEPSHTIDSPPMVDRFGQNIRKEWAGKTKSENELHDFLTKQYAGNENDLAYKTWSRYGGDLNVRYEATGFFRTHFDGKRWTLVDPDGYRFISAGLDCCNPGEMSNYGGIEILYDELPDRKQFVDAYRIAEGKRHGYDNCFVSFAITNLIRVFGEGWFDKWAKITRNRLVEWNFNTIANWSDLQFIRKAQLPYVWPLDVGNPFPTTPVCIFRDFPDVYDPVYESNAAVFAQRLADFSGDPYMIGYFLRNEPQWAFVRNLLIAEKVLENPENTFSKQEFIRWLREKYGTIAALNAAWNREYKDFADLNSPQYVLAAYSPDARADAEAFSRKMIRRFVEIPGKACKAVDPHHLNLGMRYAFLVDPILLEGYENFDVFSINCYEENAYKQIQQVGELINMPVMIGEFHFGALDVGMMAAGLCSVMTQKDRGLAYRMYYEKSFDSPYFIGAHYFILNDQATLGRFDGENLQIGLVDVCHRPYDDFVEEVRRTNAALYEIADGRRTVPEPVIQKIPRLMGF